MRQRSLDEVETIQNARHSNISNNHVNMRRGLQNCKRLVTGRRQNYLVTAAFQLIAN